MEPLLADSTVRPVTRRVTHRRLRASTPLLLVATVALGSLALLGSPAAPVRATSSPGAELYAQHCASCHQPGGQGIPGAFPPLVGNPAAADPDNVLDAIVNGRSGPVEILGVSYDGVMEPVPELSGDELDAVVAHVTRLAGATTGENGSAPAAATDGQAEDDADGAADGAAALATVRGPRRRSSPVPGFEPVRRRRSGLRLLPQRRLDRQPRWTHAGPRPQHGLRRPRGRARPDRLARQTRRRARWRRCTPIDR